MGMIFDLVRVSPPQIEAMRANPSLTLGITHVSSRLAGGSTLEEILNEPPPNVIGPPEFVQEFVDQHEAELTGARAVASLGIAPSLSLDKEWHVLHFLLTGSAEPVEAAEGALFAGERIGDDLGYGPARLLSPAATTAFAAALAALTVETLAARIDVKAMDSARVYGAYLDHSRPREIMRALDCFLPALQSYLAEARTERAGLLMWIS